MKNNNNWLLMVLVGIISATVALLFAPKSGKQLRKDIKNKSIETRDTIKRGKDDLVSDFKEAYFEAERDVERELEIMDNRQKELRDTITAIENDLQS